MTITPRVRHELSPHADAHDALHQLTARAGLVAPTDAQPPVVTPPRARWSAWEHERFLEALELFPTGPWAQIARHIGSKTPRQVMTHAQKYRQKLQRHQRREQARQRTEQARLAAEAARLEEDDAALARMFVLSVEPSPIEAPASTDAAEDARLAAAVEEVLALLEADRAPASASSSEDSFVDPEELLRWTDQFFVGVEPPSSELEPIP